jgi:hypothetical protein
MGEAFHLRVKVGLGSTPVPGVVSGVGVSGTLPPRESRVPRLNAVTRQRGSLCSPDTRFELTTRSRSVFDGTSKTAREDACAPGRATFVEPSRGGRRFQQSPLGEEN